MRGPLFGIFALMLLVSVASVHVQEGQWPKFRGLDAGAIADDPRLPEVWSETENVVWQADIPGLGWSSPVVWDDHIFVTTAISATPAARAYTIT